MTHEQLAIRALSKLGVSSNDIERVISGVRLRYPSHSKKQVVLNGISEDEAVGLACSEYRMILYLSPEDKKALLEELRDCERSNRGKN